MERTIMVALSSREITSLIDALRYANRYNNPNSKFKLLDEALENRLYGIRKEM